MSLILVNLRMTFTVLHVKCHPPPPHRLMCVNTWSLAGGTLGKILECLRSGAWGDLLGTALRSCDPALLPDFPFPKCGHKVT